MNAHKDGAAGLGSAGMALEEHRLEDLKMMAVYAGPVVSFEVREPFYLASCDHCGWVGSTELCGTDAHGDDSDVYCPRCQSGGVDCGKVATLISPDAEARLSGRRMSLLKSQCEVRDDRWRVTIDAGEDPCSLRVIHRQHGDYYDWPEATMGNCVAADRAYVMQEESRFPARSSALKAAHDFLRRFGAGEVEYLEFDVDSQGMVVVGHAERRSMSGWHRHVADTVDPLAPFYPEPPAS